MRLLLTTSTSAAPQYSSPVDFDNLPPQLRSVLGVLAHAVNSREPAIRAAVDQLRTKHPNYDNHQLALAFIRSTRRRVAATGALRGASPSPRFAISPASCWRTAAAGSSRGSLPALPRRARPRSRRAWCLSELASRSAPVSTGSR